MTSPAVIWAFPWGSQELPQLVQLVLNLSSFEGLSPICLGAQVAARTGEVASFQDPIGSSTGMVGSPHGLGRSLQMSRQLQPSRPIQVSPFPGNWSQKTPVEHPSGETVEKEEGERRALRKVALPAHGNAVEAQAGSRKILAIRS